MTDTLNTPALPIVNFEPEAIAQHVCRAVAELGDRNSPEGQPDMMLVTADELLAIVIEAFADQAAEMDTEGGRESVEDALAIVESFGPGTAGVNDTFARQILLAAEVKRLRALAARSTTPSPAAPDGWRLVPIEPTAAMIEAGHQHTLRADEGHDKDEIYRARGQAIAAYSDMLLAAPVSPNTAGEVL